MKLFSNTLIFLLQKMWVAFVHVFSKKYQCICHYPYQILTSLANKFVKFWTTAPCLFGALARHAVEPHITKTSLFKYIENFTTKKWIFFRQKFRYFFYISAQNIDCGYSLESPRRGGSNEYPQSMFLSKNKKNNVYPCKPQFYYIKVGFEGVKII